MYMRNSLYFSHDKEITSRVGLVEFHKGNAVLAQAATTVVVTILAEQCKDYHRKTGLKFGLRNVLSFINWSLSKDFNTCV